MTKYYIDTCIWRDYVENRKDRFRPLGEWAHRMLNQFLVNDDTIICSEMVIRELEVYFDIAYIKNIFSPYKKIIRTIKIDDIIMFEAKRFRNTLSKGDAIHAAIAKHTGAILITRDKHFESIGIEAKKPEELI